MKILHAVHLFAPATGGVEHHTYNLAKELVALGNTVEVFSSKLPNTAKEEVLLGIKVKRFFSISVPMFSSVRFSPGMFMAMLKSDADVFCSHGYGSLMPFFTAIAALIRRKPFVFTLHGYPRLQGISKLFQIFYKFFFASIYLRISKRIIIVSKISANDMEKEIGKQAAAKKLAYIPNGVDVEKFSCGGFGDSDTISYVGRLDRDKGIDVLIRAFANVKRKFRNLKLAIIGKDEGMKKDLVSLAYAFEMEKDVVFSEVPYEKISGEYCNSLAIILPSKYEGFPLVWLEAAASSRPMFSTRVGDYENFFGTVYGEEKEQFLFSSQAELEEKLSYFLSDKSKFAPIVESARARMRQDFSWKHIAQETIGLYLSLKK